jgi:hypothetical protein
MSQNPPISAKDQFDYAWKHFAFISEQRIRSFNFYIILLVATVGGTITVFEKLHRLKPMLMCGVWNIFIGFVFLIIDVRSKRMLEIPKNSLRTFEAEPTWIGQKLILADDQQAGSHYRWISFTTAFRATFFAQILAGILIFLYAQFI